MKQHVKQIRTLLGVMKTNVATLTTLLEYRSKFIKDPANAVLDTVTDPRLSVVVAKYNTLFKNPVNVALGTSDALSEINGVVLAAANDVDEFENKIFKEFNSVNTDVTAIVTELKENQPSYALSKNLDRMLSSAPAMEVYGPKLINRLNMIMTNEQIPAISADAWLYGILKDLEEDNLDELLDTSSVYETITEVMDNGNEIPSRYLTTSNEQYNSVGDTDYSGYRTIQLLACAPKADLGIVAIISVVMSMLDKVVTTPALDTIGAVVDYTGYTLSVYDSLSALFKEPSAIIPEEDNVPAVYAMQVNKLTLLGSGIVVAHAPAYAELHKYRAITRLMFDLSSF